MHPPKESPLPSGRPSHSRRAASSFGYVHVHLSLCQRAESGTSTREIPGDGFLLIGDAGLAYHQSGEGILPAIESGLLAATTIAASDGEYDKEHLAPYHAMLAGQFGGPQWQWIPQIGRHLPA